MKATSSERSRDFGRVLGPLLAACAVLIGVAVAALVVRDALYGHGLQVRVLGPAPLLVNDWPFLWTGLACTLLLGFAFMLAWALRMGSWDVPAFGILVISLFADVVPGIYQLGLLLVLFVVLERALRDKEVPLGLTPLFAPLGIILLSYLTTFVTSTGFAVTATNLVYRSSYMFLVILLPAILRTRRHLDLLLKFLIVGACISAAVGLVQLGLSLATQRPVTFAGQYNRVVTPFGVFPRCTGLMQHPNHQSNTLAPVAVLVLYFATRPKGMIRAATRALYLAVYVFLVIGVFVTWSRSGWLALGVCSLLVPLLRWPRFTVHYLVALSAIAIIAVQTGAAGAFYSGVRELNASSADFRWHIDHIAVQSFADAPWLGRGVGGILDYYNPYHLQVHNTYLQVLSEMGVLGATGVGLLLGILGVRVWRQLHRARTAYDRDWIVALMLAGGIILVQNLFAMFLWVKFLWAWIALMEAAVTVSSRAPDLPDEHPDLFLPEPTPAAAHGA